MNLAQEGELRSGTGRRRLLKASATAVVVAALAVASTFGARENTPSPRPLAPAVGRSVDGASARLSRARIAQSASPWLGGATTASTGESVSVYVSSALPEDHGTAQTWADFIAGLVHGPEISLLTAYIAPLSEVQEICGEGALGCYGDGRMVSVGETEYGVTAAEVVRHEYGHHVAWNRQNPPWRAVDWGPKNWASRANVCRRASDGSAYPGDEDSHYRLNPGEAWAETYRLMDERAAGATGSGWQIVDSSFYPDASALDAAEKDVREPWSTGVVSTFRHRFTAKTKRAWTLSIATPLDGGLTINLRLPKGGLQAVVLLDDNKPVATASWSGQTAKRITTMVCGQRSLVLRVTQRGAQGRVVAVIERP